MKNHLYPLIAILILIGSCRQQETSNDEINEQNPTHKTNSENKSKTQDPSLEEQSIENDNIVSKLEDDLNEIIRRYQFTIEKEPTENRHVENQIDTIVTRSFKNSKIESYKVKGEEMIYHAKIADAGFTFLNNIGIGASKGDLEKQLDTELKSDVIKIGNFTGNIVFIFRFEKEKLKEIVYDGYVD